MLPVSYKYKKSMKAPLRERGYLKANIKVVNDDFQHNGNVTTTENLLYSNVPIENVLKYGEPHTEYATFENDFIKVDGKSTKFMKTVDVNDNPGFVSKDVSLSGLTKFSISISNPLGATTFTGLTLDFGDNYAVGFDVTSDKGEEIEVTNNQSNIWFTDHTFTDVSTITITIRKLRYTYNRARLYGVLFGFNLEFNNENIIRATLNDHISPISAEIPQSDFSITVDNHDRKFDFDNPKSPINMITENEPMTIQYGYEAVENQIEWLKPFKMYCDEWDCDRTKAEFRCVDRFRGLNEIYDTGSIGSGLTVAENILTFAGVDSSEYELDEKALGNTRILYPFPKVSCKEGLQLIANLCCCTLSLARDGKIVIKKTTMPKVVDGGFNGKVPILPGTDVKQLFKQNEPVEYAMMLQDYITVDGTMKFAKEQMTGSGYVSDGVSDSTGSMKGVEYGYILKIDPKGTYNHVRMIFAQNACPKELHVSVMYLESSNTLANKRTYVVTKTGATTVSDFYMDLYKPETRLSNFEFIKVRMYDTVTPNSRLILKKVIVDNAYSFTMGNVDMMSNPILTNESRIGKLDIPYHTHTLNNEAEVIFSENITIKDGIALNLKFDEPHKEYQVKVDDVLNKNVMDVLGSPYDIDITFLAGFSGEHKIEVLAKGYTVNEFALTKVVNKGCKNTVRWDNPLITTEQDAIAVGEWLAEYYRHNKTYSYNTRGNPELEVGDEIYQVNDYLDDMPVQIYEQTIEFSQGFKGKVKTRRLGG